MERIERNGGNARWVEPTPEKIFIFDIHGAVHEVVCDRSGGAAAPRKATSEPRLSPGVIQRWLACLAVALLGLGLLADPGAALEPVALSAVLGLVRG